MKIRTLAVTLAATLITSIAMADIQNAPRDAYTPVRKLGRGLGNIAYGISEIPDTMINEQKQGGTKQAWSSGLTNGVWRTVQRVGYGAFETVTFTIPTYKSTYRQPYKRSEIYPTSGLSEFAPELGFKTGTTYSRQR